MPNANTPKLTRLQAIQGALAGELLANADMLTRDDLTNVSFSINIQRDGQINTVVRFEVRHG